MSRMPQRARWLHRLATILLLLCVCCSIAVSQTTMGTITGLVTDASQALIPGVTVTAVNAATGAQAQTTTSSSGNYVIPNLPVGTYEIKANYAGMKTWTRSNIALSSADNIRIDITLQVGQATEVINVVEAAQADLKTESTEVSTTMERKLVEDVPLPIAGIGGGMRNAFSLMIMLPQVRTANGESAWDDFNIAGGQQHNWNVSVDGLSVEMGWRNHVGYMNRLTPPVDALQEFHIQTANFKAEDSRASGGNISLITKSGTNQLHGSAFDYYQTQRLNANSYNNNRQGARKNPYHRNDFGANAGGPVYIPKVYNGKDKSYFYFAYEGYRYPQTSGPSELTIPTPRMIAGDFSEWRKADGSLIPIYDPSATRNGGAGDLIREQFAGNQIPASRMSPIAAKIAKYFPATNLPGLQRNYRTPGNGARKRIEDAYLAKADHNFGMKNRLSFTFTKNGVFFNNAYDANPTDPMAWGGSLPYPLAGRQYTKGDQYYGKVFRLNDTHLLSPNLVNTFTLGMHRLYHPEHDVTANGSQKWGDLLGATRNNPYSNTTFPAVFFDTDNYYGWESTKLWDEYHTSYGLDESLSWVKNNHNVKAGYHYSILHLNTNNRNEASGVFRFRRESTAALVSRNADASGNSGNAFASFLLGQVYAGSFGVPSPQMMREPYHAFFLQDDWKITRKLTMNIGLRYEVNVGTYEKHDRLSRWDPTLPNPKANGLPGALTFLGNGAGRLGTRHLWDNSTGWGPRFGLAYQVAKDTVIRGGLGIFYAPEKAPGLGGANDGFTAHPGFNSPDGGISPAFVWDEGFPAWTAPPFIDSTFNTGNGIPYWNPHELALLPSNTSWNLAISRALPGRLVLDVTYTGNKGTHLPSNRVNDMQLDAKYASLGGLLNRPIEDPAVVALGYKPPFTDFKKVMGGNATLGQSLRKWPQYTGVQTNGMMNHSGNSTYHAMIAKVTKRFSNGLSLVSDFTWSKLLTDADSSEPWIASFVGSGIGGWQAMDNNNRRLEKSYSVIDLPAMFKTTASYDLPFGPRRKFFNSGVGSHILGNWTLATYTFAQSGYPLGVVDNGYNNNLRAGPNRPNVTAYNWRAPISGGKFDPYADAFLSRTPFVRVNDPTQTPFGTGPRFIGATRSPGRVRSNVTISRSFPIRERAHLDFRWEINDLCNAKTWNNPNLDLANVNFGRIFGADGNRSMQAALKFVF